MTTIALCWLLGGGLLALRKDAWEDVMITIAFWPFIILSDISGLRKK